RSPTPRGAGVPYATLCRSHEAMVHGGRGQEARDRRPLVALPPIGQDEDVVPVGDRLARSRLEALEGPLEPGGALGDRPEHRQRQDRKSTRLNSSHVAISYA